MSHLLVCDVKKLIGQILHLKGTHLFHNISTGILVTATIINLAIALDFGSTPVRT